MKLVSSFGGIYRLSNKAYLQVLYQIAAGDGYDLNRVGAKYLGDTRQDLTDMTSEEAQDLLDEA